MNKKTINASPKPALFIKSISEQGYSLETALADLIDNSITAKANFVDIVTHQNETDNNLTVFIADNGTGMSSSQLQQNMQLPSNDVDNSRDNKDLGRFGLGLKTASFSQTRKFTVISRDSIDQEFYALTWDVNHLEKTEKWEIIENSSEEINTLINSYKQLSHQYLNTPENFEIKTLIIWSELKNFKTLKNESARKQYYDNELELNVREHLGLVFHRFLEKDFNIRINNVLIESFNPFVSKSKTLPRSIETKQYLLENGDRLEMQGFILPVTALKNENEWCPKHKSLRDLEGLFIYREERIIFYGGWNNLIRRSAKLKLARLKISIGNKNDRILHLNVAKSKIKIPYELETIVLKTIEELKDEAIKEHNNRGLRESSSRKNKSDKTPPLLTKNMTSNKGLLYNINKEFPLIQLIYKGLDEETKTHFNSLLRVLNVTLNKQRGADFSNIKLEEQSDINIDDVLVTIKNLQNQNVPKQFIETFLIHNLGFNQKSLPLDIENILKSI